MSPVLTKRSKAELRPANHKKLKASANHAAGFFIAPNGQKFIGEPKIVVLDIETAPLLGYAWGRYEQDILEEEHSWYMLSVAWKKLGSPKTHVKTLPDFKRYKEASRDDFALLEQIWGILDTYDVIVGQNIDRFDLRKIHARFLVHSMPPPRPYMTIDTLKIARKFFSFDSNKLDDLGKQLGVGRKLKTHGKDTWLGCMQGNMREWGNMKRYNKQDVILNELVFEKMLPWLAWKENRRKAMYAKSY